MAGEEEKSTSGGRGEGGRGKGGMKGKREGDGKEGGKEGEITESDALEGT